MNADILAFILFENLICTSYSFNIKAFFFFFYTEEMNSYIKEEVSRMEIDGSWQTKIFVEFLLF